MFSPAPLLKDVELVAEDCGNPYDPLYRQCCHILRHLFHDCRLVHADFSEFNLLCVLCLPDLMFVIVSLIQEFAMVFAH